MAADEAKTSQQEKQNLMIGIREDKLMQDCQSGGLKKTFPDIDYSLYGYNILKGYPMADGRDPGFTRPVFAFDFSERRHTADCRYSLPNGLTAAPDVACRTSFTSSTIENSLDLKRSLSRQASVSARGWGVSFSASSGYQSASSTFRAGKFKIIQSVASCKYYFAKLNELDIPDFSPEVMEWIGRMNKTITNTGAIDDGLLYDFVDYFGTHFPSEMVYGARFMYQHIISSSKSESKSSSSSSYNVNAQANFFSIFSLSGGFSLSESQSSAASAFRESARTTTISIGAPPPYDGDAMTWASTVKDAPVPMQYAFIPIYELFDDRRLNVKKILSTRHTRQIRDGLLRISSSYCRKLENKGLEVLCNDDSVMKIANFDNYAMDSVSFKNIKNFTLDECITECNKRKNCKMVTMYPSTHRHYKAGTQCRLDVDDTQGTRVTLRRCNGCNTYVDPHALPQPMGLTLLRYDLSVVRLNKMSILHYSTFAELNEFCALVCTSYSLCLGYEVTNSSDFKFNCATYKEHSETLVSTTLYNFETYMMPDFAKRAFRKSKLDYGIPLYGMTLVSTEYSNLLNCDYQCCRKTCLSNINCLALSSNQVLACKMFMNDWNTEFVEVKQAADVVEFFPERAVSGWLNFTTDSSLSRKLENSELLNITTIAVENVRTADDCASHCKTRILCVAAAWELSTNCMNYMYSKNNPVQSHSVFRINTTMNGFMVMVPNHRQRIDIFKILT